MMLGSLPLLDGISDFQRGPEHFVTSPYSVTGCHGVIRWFLENAIVVVATVIFWCPARQNFKIQDLATCSGGLSFQLSRMLHDCIKTALSSGLPKMHYKLAIRFVGIIERAFLFQVMLLRPRKP